MKPLLARHRLDILPSDLKMALAMMGANEAASAASALERLWAPDGRGLACYSVRSGFHLLLSALNLPRGSEVMFSAVTHPDMPRLAAHHGLVPVPIDLDPGTLAPHQDLAHRSVTGRARVLVVAHLFGGRVPLDGLSSMCKSQGIVLVEDCAQAFRGPHAIGDPLADVSMFSFGILKTSTALGGAMLTVRDRALRDRMRVIQRTWRVQARRSHLKRIAQAAAFTAMTRPFAYGSIALGAAALNVDFDGLVSSSARAFPATNTAELVHRLEQRPSAALSAFLAHRLANFDHARLAARAESGELLASIIPSGLHIGGRALDHTHWLFPVVADRRSELIQAARAAGFDAAAAASSVRAIHAPSDRPELEPFDAIGVMSRLVFLPAYPELPEGSLERLAAVLEREVSHAHASV